MENLLFLGVPILKHIRVKQVIYVVPDRSFQNQNLVKDLVRRHPAYQHFHFFLASGDCVGAYSEGQKILKTNLHLCGMRKVLLLF